MIDIFEEKYKNKLILLAVFFSTLCVFTILSNGIVERFATLSVVAISSVGVWLFLFHYGPLLFVKGMNYYYHNSSMIKILVHEENSIEEPESKQMFIFLFLITLFIFIFAGLVMFIAIYLLSFSFFFSKYFHPILSQNMARVIGLIIYSMFLIGIYIEWFRGYYYIVNNMGIPGVFDDEDGIWVDDECIDNSYQQTELKTYEKIILSVLAVSFLSLSIAHLTFILLRIL